MQAIRAEKARRSIERNADEVRARCKSLLGFVRQFWHVLEPKRQLIEGWPLVATCLHLEAVTRGDLNRLLANVPPGFMKSLLVNVFWPAWEWGPMGLTSMRYVAFSYASSLTERDNGKFRDLILSPEYQALYGDVFQLRTVGVTKIENDKTGWKLASSIGGVGTGERGDRVLLDDPHNVKEAESETVRQATVTWFVEAMSNRLNDLDESAIVVIMQRVHEGDVSGEILAAEMDYTHLMIPWDYDPGRHCETEIGWSDPRTEEDEPAWPERFSAEAMARFRPRKFMWASQYQQSPEPRGGSIFQRDWWQLWEAKDGKFPAFEYLIASVDSAFTEKQQNDPSALTVWGVFIDPEAQRRIMLVHAWRKYLAFSGPRIDTLPRESPQAYRRRTMDSWGLIEWVNDTCNRFKVDKLLIEAKANGISAAQELRNRFGLQNWDVQLCQVKGDKVARALACQPTFSQMMVYAPERDWAEDVIAEMAVFPKGRYDDLTDTATQAINYLRSVGLARTDDEVKAEEAERVTHRPKQSALYPV